MFSLPFFKFLQKMMTTEWDGICPAEKAFLPVFKVSSPAWLSRPGRTMQKKHSSGERNAPVTITATGGVEMTPGFEIARGNSRSIRPFMNIPVCKGVSRLSRRLPTTHCSGNPMPKLLCCSRECTPFLNESPGLVIGPMCSKGLVLVEHFGFAKTEGKSLLKMAAILSLLKNLLQDRTLSTG